jgi:hypothetical protein
MLCAPEAGIVAVLAAGEGRRPRRGDATAQYGNGTPQQIKIATVTNTAGAGERPG